MVDVCTVMAVSLPGGTRMNHAREANHPIWALTWHACDQRKLRFDALDPPYVITRNGLVQSRVRSRFHCKNVGKIL